MVDIASTLAEGMRAEGVPCELVPDGIPTPADAATLQVVVAPHEYFPLFLQQRLLGEEFERAIAATHLLNVEQPGSMWFERTWNYARLSRGVFDISAEGAAEFRRRGIEATHTPLGIVSAPQTLPIASARPIDILFLGHTSPRREQFFAEHASVFSSLESRLLFVDVARPRGLSTPGYVSAQPRSSLLSRSKILINIHSADRFYFEAHRALMALSHGCVLVSETSEGTDPLVNGTHFVMAPLSQLAEECRRLIDDPDRLSAIAQAGQTLAHTRLTMADSCRTMIARAGQGSQARTRSLSDDQLREVVRARLRASLTKRAAGGVDWTVEENVPFSSSGIPRISVIVTLFNYGGYLGECLQSIETSADVPGGVEAVIVDDGSTDDSADRASRLAASTAIPVRLVRKHHNTGLADARNIGLQLARGDLVLTLDADNWLYPGCLRALSDALANTEVAAAYPILRRFRSESDESIGLLSQYPWSTRELLRGPYIDALAMFRRDVLQSLGGYSTELLDYGWFGWEDYDLWLKLAEAGHLCAQVPERSWLLTAYTRLQ